jgi:hypothetical protein
MLADVVRPLGAFTLAVQPPKIASIRTAPTAVKRMFRMVFGFPLNRNAPLRRVSAAPL